VPVPASATVRVTGGLNVAVTVVLALRVTTQEPVPLHEPPDQPAKVDWPEAEAVSVTFVPTANCAAH
jgi:hypothetical protein